MKTKTLNHLLGFAAAIVLLAGTSCKKTTTDTTPATVLTGVQISANAKLGNIITDNNGFSLYFFSKDGDAFGNLWAIARADYTVMFGSGQLVGLDGLNYTDAGVAGTATSQFLTDANGRTHYQFTRDTHNTNTFTKADLSNDTVWPMDRVTTIGSIPTVFDKTQFSLITSQGISQLNYKGHPVYYFGQDNGTRGNTKGVSFPTPGGAVWKVLNTTTAAL